MSGVGPWKDAHGNYLEVEERDGVLLLTYGDDEESRAFPLDRDALPALVAALTEHMGARVVGGTDGLDQGDPAAWLVEHVNGCPAHVTLTEKSARSMVMGHGPTARYVPLYRAPGAVAAAPPGDEDGVTHTPGLDAADPLHRARILAAGLARWQIDGPAVPAVVTVAGQIVAALDTVLAAAPPAGHEDEAAVERAVRDLCAVRYFDGTAEGRGANMALDSILVALDVLAAARGPRTPDPGAGA